MAPGGRGSPRPVAARPAARGRPGRERAAGPLRAGVYLRRRIGAIGRHGHRSKAPGGILGGQVALRLGQQLIANHELPNVGSQERRVEVGMQLPRLGRAVAERRLVPAHGVREGPLEQAVIALQHLAQDGREPIPRRGVEVGQASGRSFAIASVSNGQAAQNGTTTSQSSLSTTTLGPPDSWST